MDRRPVSWIRTRTKAEFYRFPMGMVGPGETEKRNETFEKQIEQSQKQEDVSQSGCVLFLYQKAGKRIISLFANKMNLSDRQIVSVYEKKQISG